MCVWGLGLGLGFVSYVDCGDRRIFLSFFLSSIHHSTVTQQQQQQ